MRKTFLLPPLSRRKQFPSRGDARRDKEREKVRGERENVGREGERGKKKEKTVEDREREREKEEVERERERKGEEEGRKGEITPLADGNYFLREKKRKGRRRLGRRRRGERKGEGVEISPPLLLRTRACRRDLGREEERRRGRKREREEEMKSVGREERLSSLQER